MLYKGLKALITCEVTDQFQQALEARGIQYELAGWGQTGDVLDDLQITSKAKDCDLLIVEIENLTREVIKDLPKLRFIGVSRGTPVNVDLDFCKQIGIHVISTPGRNADSVADYCLGMMIQGSRKLSASAAYLSSNGWMFEGKLPYLEFRGREIGNLTVGLYGIGQIGSRVAKRLKDGFGTNVIYFDPFVTSNENATPVPDLETLFSHSDIVSIHAPAIDATRNTVNRALLSSLGPEGLLVNAARAQIVDEEDLYTSLVQGEIAGAALDVYWNEPLDKESRWLKLSNVICTPHIAGASLDVVDNHCKTILTGIDNWLNNAQNGGS